MRAGRIPGVERIAVLRANSLGDLIVTLPALEALKAAYPGADLTLLGKPWHVEFLTGRPGPVDRVEAIPALPGVSIPGGAALSGEQRAAIEDFVERMRRERFDLAVQLHGGGRNSNRLLARLGARVTAGFRTPDAPPLTRWVPYVYWQHEVFRYLEVVALVGAAAVSPYPRLAVTDADVREARAALSAAGVADDLPLIVLHPGATDPRRRWPPERFAGVGAALAKEGLQVVVVGVEAERALSATIVGHMGGLATDLTGRLGLRGLAGLLRLAALIVCNDSGPHHLGMAVGTPSVAVYWCGNLVNTGPLRTTRHRALTSWRLECPSCGFDCMRGRCPHDDSFVAEITEDEVLAAARELLALPPTATLETVS